MSHYISFSFTHSVAIANCFMYKPLYQYALPEQMGLSHIFIHDKKKEQKEDV